MLMIGDYSLHWLYGGPAWEGCFAAQSLSLLLQVRSRGLDQLDVHHQVGRPGRRRIGR
jgi:hypothetical protein